MTDPVSTPERAPEDIPAFDHARAEAAVRELLAAIGEDPDREGLLETPARVARAYAELTQGMRQTADDVTDPGDEPRRVNLLTWDGKGRPAGLFPPRRDTVTGTGTGTDGSDR